MSAIMLFTFVAAGSLWFAISHLSVQVIGPRFKVHQGQFTGELEGQGCYGASKVPRIHAGLISKGLRLSMSRLGQIL